jgi:hypothetical protein
MAGQMTMPVPGASALMGATPSLADQVKGETDEQRRKRLQGMQAARQLPGMSDVVGSGYGAAMGG